MARIPVQFQGTSLVGFFTRYDAEEQRRKTLFQWHWPDGFVCPECGEHRYDALHKRKLVTVHTPTPADRESGRRSRQPVTQWQLKRDIVTQKAFGADLAQHRTGVDPKPQVNLNDRSYHGAELITVTGLGRK